MKNYAIIDHVGSIETDVRVAYSKVFTKANGEGYNKDNLFTMKKVCMMESPFAKEITDKMKYRIRYQKNPNKVYFICPEVNFYVEREIVKWTDRDIPVRVFEIDRNREYDYETFFDTHQYSFHDNRMSVNRRLAEMWAPAFGYQFSAPISRIDREMNAENFCKRPDHDELVASGETHFTKPFTNEETFLEMNCCIATDSEIKEFRKYLDEYLAFTNCTIDTKVGASFGSVSGDTSALAEYLDPDYIICETCKRPHRLHQGDVECPHCKAVMTEDIVLETYFEDSFED